MNSPSKIRTPQKSKKPSQPINSPLINNKEFDQKLNRLTTRLSRQNICKQHKLITNMNLKLEVLLEHVFKLEELKNLKFDDALKMISHVPFLEWVNDKYSFGQIQQSDKGYSSSNNKNFIMQNEHTVSADKELLRLKYPNSEKTIILTGITKIWTQAAIRQFNQNHGQYLIRHNSYKKAPSIHHHSTCEIVGVNDFWIAIQADNAVNALAFKKFIRQRKKAFEQKRDISFKQDKKRVRIVMQNQDFYTLLVDAMTQKKNIEFTKRMVNPNSGMFPSMCLRDMKKVTAFPNEDYQMSLKKINRVLYFPIIFNRPQIKQPQEHFTLEDVYSEDRSKRSDMLDSINSMNDLIEKADQGTQAESLGVGTHDMQLNTDFFANGYESDLLDSVRDISPLKSSPIASSNFINQKEIQDRSNDINKNTIKDQTLKTQNQHQNPDEQSQSDLDSVPQISTNQNRINLQVKNLHPNNQENPKISQQKYFNPSNDQDTGSNTLEITNISKLNPVSLLSVREPQLTAKMLKFSFSVYSQTQMTEINYTKMKRLQAEYQKKSVNRLKLAPGIPEEFRQVSYEMRNKELFVENLLKSMEKNSQKKEFALYY